MLNHNRRKILKILSIGGGIVVLTKIFGSDLLNMVSPQSEDSMSRKQFSNFEVEESKKSLKVFSKTGEELFIIDSEK